MKIILLFFFTFMVDTIVTILNASDKLQHVILAEIIQSTKEINNSLTTEIFVQKVITAEDCSNMSFCKAGKILSAYKAKELGVKDEDWLLPRRLVALTRGIHCKYPALEEKISFRHLLDNICWCAQKEYSTPPLESTLSHFT